MGLIARSPAPALAHGDGAIVAWHDLECGRYRADLDLWRELAEQAATGAAPARILDVGAGAGRVTLTLARAGHAITALDLDPVLLHALSTRAASESLNVLAVCADARHFSLEDRGFDLCAIPMQTVQLLGGADGRIAFLKSARAHLRSGAILACAIVTDLEPFDCQPGQPGPAPEAMRVDGVAYSSQAVAVHLLEDRIRIERVRTITTPSGCTSEHNEIELDRISAATLAHEGHLAGFEPAGVREISETDEHVGSEVVLLRA